MVDADLRSMGRHYYALRGWLMVPTGALFIAAGLTNMPPIGDEPVNRAGLFALAVVAVAAGVAYYLVDRHYRTTFGRIDPASSTKVRVTAYTVVAAIVICAPPIWWYAAY